MWGGGVAIMNGVIGAGITEVTSERRLERTGKVSYTSLREVHALWLEGTDGGKALRWEHA